MRFALVGCGVIAQTHARALAALHDHAKLVSCFDVVPARAAALAEEFKLRPVAEYTEILNDDTIDAVTVCTPSGLHADVGVPALLAGKHVIVEKPMDVSVEACDRLLDAQCRSGAQLGVICQTRFDRASQQVKRATADGSLGRLVFADCRVPWFRAQDYYDADSWRGTWELDGGGCLINQAIHTVDLLRWICGPVRSVYAQARTATHESIEVEDIICATIVFENDALATLMAATCLYPGFPSRLAVHGTLGSAVIEGGRLAALAIVGGDAVASEAPSVHAVQLATGGTRVATRALNHLPAAPSSDAEPWGEGHRRQLLDFIQAVENDTRPLVDGIQGRNAVELIQAIYESARAGDVVSMSGSHARGT